MAEGCSVARTSSPPTDEGIRSMDQGKLWLKMCSIYNLARSTPSRQYNIISFFGLPLDLSIDIGDTLCVSNILFLLLKKRFPTTGSLL